MADFDVQQVVEAAARAFYKVEWPQYLGKPTRIDLEATRAALAVIVPAVTEQIRALHKPVHLTFSWAQGVRAEDPCEVCGGKAGNDRECGCWGDVDRYVYCLACSDLSGHTSHHEDHPCPTVRLCDELDAAARGEQP